MINVDEKSKKQKIGKSTWKYMDFIYGKDKFHCKFKPEIMQNISSKHTVDNTKTGTSLGGMEEQVEVWHFQYFFSVVFIRCSRNFKLISLVLKVFWVVWLLLCSLPIKVLCLTYLELLQWPAILLSYLHVTTLLLK